MTKESQNIEWKESWRDEYLKWICGFANAQGGKIYIGKDNNGVVSGLKDAERLLEDIPNKISNFLGIIADVNLYTENGRDYIEIAVSPNTYPVSYKGEYHYRTGSTKQQLKGAALNHFLLKKTGITWDSVPIDNVKIADLRSDSFDIFKEQAVRSKRMNKQDVDLSKEELLSNLKLMEHGIINRAGILLFHHNPENWIVGSYIKIGYFETDADLRYQDEVHGSLISQADKVVDLLFTKYLKAYISYEGVTRVETYPYPKEALREAIYNAIAHKNYASLIPIQISVYKDRIYIGNECVFPDDWTLDDLLGKHNSRPYNPLIANTFFRAGYIESWGRGIQKIRESCEENGNKMAEYKVSSSEIMVMFQSLKIIETNQDYKKSFYNRMKTYQHLLKTDQGNAKTNQGNIKTDQDNIKTDQGKRATHNQFVQNAIIEIIKVNGEATQREMAEITGETLSTIKYHIEKMKKNGIIERNGSSQSGNWKINNE